MPDYKSALMGAMELLDRPARRLRGMTGLDAEMAADILEENPSSVPAWRLMQEHQRGGLDREMERARLTPEMASSMLEDPDRQALDRQVLEHMLMKETEQRRMQIPTRHYTSALSSLGGQRPSAGPDPVRQRLQQYEEDSARRWQAEEARRRMAMAREATARNPYVSPFSAPRGPSYSPSVSDDPRGGLVVGHVPWDTDEPQAQPLFPFETDRTLMHNLRQLEWADEAMRDVQRLDQPGAERRLLEQRLEDLRYE